MRFRLPGLFKVESCLSPAEPRQHLTDMASIYLAGPEVFFPDPDGEAAGLKEICAELGLEGRFPTDCNAERSEDPVETAGNIYKGNVELIDACDGVIANMVPFRGVSMDVGTAFEIGYAIAQGKPVFGWSKDKDRNYSDRVKTMEIDDGMSVEEFTITDNLMVVIPLCGEVVHSSFREAAAAAAAHFAK